MRMQLSITCSKTRPNNIFAPGGVDVWLKVLLSLFRLVLGTVRSFKFPPDRKYLRWALAMTVTREVRH